MQKTIPERVAKRAYERWTDGENECHISTYSVASHGYAQIGWQDPGMKRSDMTTAHRAAWTHVHGQIPERMDIDHVCRNPRCVNVEHLRLLTPEDNRRRNKGDYELGLNCKRDHPPESRVRTGRGMVCRDCNLARIHEFYERKRQARRPAVA